MAQTRKSPLRFARIGLCVASLALTLGTASCGLIGATVSTAIALAPLKLLFACLPEGTEIDVPGGDTQPVEDLRAGDLVIGFAGEPVRVLQVHGYMEDPDESEFHAITFSNGSTVDLCGMHRIEGIRAQDLEVGTSLASGHSVTEIRNYLGVERSYDLLTEDEGYRVGGVPVNSMIEEMYRAGQTRRIER